LFPSSVALLDKDKAQCLSLRIQEVFRTLRLIILQAAADNPVRLYSFRATDKLSGAILFLAAAAISL
jgi:hypothetical protein|tara:strand:+ start:145 stop:345 length:201 start_codon:yes stop_codon:yes gene_type:complete